MLAKRGIPDWQQLEYLFDQWQPDELVIGYPLKIDGSRFKLTDQVDQMIALLKSRYPHYVLHMADERLSTVYAKERLYEQQGRKALIKGLRMEKVQRSF